MVVDWLRLNKTNAYYSVISLIGNKRISDYKKGVSLKTTGTFPCLDAAYSVYGVKVSVGILLSSTAPRNRHV